MWGTLLLKSTSDHLVLCKDSVAKCRLNRQAERQGFRLYFLTRKTCAGTNRLMRETQDACTVVAVCVVKL